MNKLEQDFLAKKQENDKLKEQLKNKEALLKEALFLLSIDIIDVFDSFPKEMKKDMMQTRTLRIFSSYSGIEISEGNDKDLAKFVYNFSKDFAKESIGKMGIDLGGLDD